MNATETYELLRTLTSPIAAVTSRRGDKLNGMISDAAIRASIVPEVPRLGVFVHKFNFSHDLIYETGAFALHVLHTGQVGLVQRLGFASGRDRDKLTGVPHTLGTKTGVPILQDCFCWFECEVCNAMDTGSSTFFMGDVVDTGKGPGAEVMEPAYLRTQLGEDLKAEYVDRLAHAQQLARRMSKNIKPVVWRGLAADDRRQTIDDRR